MRKEPRLNRVEVTYRNGEKVWRCEKWKMQFGFSWIGSVRGTVEKKGTEIKDPLGCGENHGLECLVFYGVEDSWRATRGCRRQFRTRRPDARQGRVQRTWTLAGAKVGRVIIFPRAGILKIG